MGNLGQFSKSENVPKTRVAAAVVPAVVAGASALANMMSSSSTNEKMIQAQEKLLGKQQQFQREMNEQMYPTYRRSLEAAGLNVNSQLGGYPNTSSSVPQGPNLTAPQFDTAGLMQAFQIQQQQPLVDAQVDLTNAQADRVRSEIPNVEADTALKKAQAFNITELTVPQRQELEEKVKNVREATENLKVDRAETMEKINLLLGQTEGQRLSNELLNQETPLILQKYAGEIANLWSQKYLNNAQTAAAYKSLSVMTAQINELNSRAKLNDSQRTYVANLAFGVALDNQFKPFEKAVGLEFTDQQIQEIKETIGKIQQDKDWAPFNNIFGAFSSPMGAAAGAYFGSRAKGSAVSGISLPVNTTWTK